MEYLGGVSQQLHPFIYITITIGYNMEVNDWADFWRNEVGANVIPANSIKKKPKVSWKDDPRGNWQIEPIPQEIHDEWKRTNAFNDGMAVICGKIHHVESKKHLYLCAVDCDNKKAIDVLTGDINRMAEKTLIERHKNPDKAHIYFYTTKPVQKKSSDAVNLEMLKKMEDNEIPAIEVKGDGTHGIMYCSPSPHKDGSNYQIMGVKEPVILDEIGDLINKICDEYSLGRDSNNKVPMKLLLNDETIIVEGSNRHEAIMRYAERMLRKYPDMEQSVFKEVIKAKNKLMCRPPLSDEDIDKQIKDAVNFIAKQIEEERKINDINRHKFGTDEFWSDVMKFKNTFNPTKKFVQCLDCKEEIEPDPFARKHYGHNVILK